jgi:hypothetical protein
MKKSENHCTLLDTLYGGPAFAKLLNGRQNQDHPGVLAASTRLHIGPLQVPIAEEMIRLLLPSWPFTCPRRPPDDSLPYEACHPGELPRGSARTSPVAPVHFFFSRYPARFWALHLRSGISCCSRWCRGWNLTVVAKYVSVVVIKR